MTAVFYFQPTLNMVLTIVLSNIDIRLVFHGFKLIQPEKSNPQTLKKSPDLLG